MPAKKLIITSATVVGLICFVPVVFGQSKSKPTPKTPSSSASLDKPSRFSETKWQNDDGTITVEFYNTGSWHETWHKKLVRGSWKIVSENEVLVLISNGKTYHFVMAQDGESVTRSDKVKYRRSTEKK